MTEEGQAFDIVEVYRARNSVEAHAVVAALDAEGITARIDGDKFESVAGELLPTDWTADPRILVDQFHADKARSIINRWQVAKDDGSRCLACGKPMTETDTACSACGWTFESEGPA